MGNAKFISGPDVNPFSKASQETIEVLESMSAIDLAMSVPYIKITQIDPHTGVNLEKPPLMLDFISAPGFGRPVKDGTHLERPLVSLQSMNLTAEAPVSLSYNRKVSLSLVVHSPGTVFFADDSFSTFRAMLQEGHTFKIEYGWVGSSKNDLINGTGVFDKKTGCYIPSINYIRVVPTTWSCTVSDDGQMTVNLSLIEDCELAYRDAKLSKYIDLSSIEQYEKNKRKKQNKRARENQKNSSKHRQKFISNSHEDIGAPAAKHILSMLSKLEPAAEMSSDGYLYKFKDILDTIVAPIVNDVCDAMGYKEVNLYLGNFSNACQNSSKALGNKKYAGRSIGEVLVSRNALIKQLGIMHASGDELTVASFINGCCCSLIQDIGNWQSTGLYEYVELVPEIYVGTSARRLSGGQTGFILFIADRHLSTISSEDGTFKRNEKLDPDAQSRQDVIQIIKSKNIPYIRMGTSNTFVKSADFNAQLDDAMRGTLTDSALRQRKTQVELQTQPDPKGREGRSDPETYTMFSSLAANITMIGNFLFNYGQTIWIDYFDIFPISGLYNIIGHEENLSSAGFSTTIRIVTTGTDPLNTRYKKSSSELMQQDLDIELSKYYKNQKASKAAIKTKGKNK